MTWADHYSTSNNLKMVQHTSILTMADQIAIKSRMIYRTAPFSMTLNDPYPQFKGHAFLWRWISQKRYDIGYKHSVNEILIGTYTRPTQQCHFEWLWVILSEVAKYSMTRKSRGLSATADLLVDLDFIFYILDFCSE